MDYNQIIKFFLSTAVIIAGLIYIGKLFLDQFAEIRIEKYKHSLQNHTEEFKHKLSFETEKFKQELNKTTIEHQIKYSKLYEERGQIIKQIYNLLFVLETSLANLTRMFQGPEWTTETERDKNVQKNIIDLRTHLEQNRIFFLAELCNNLESILEDAHKITVDIYVAKSDQQHNDNSNKSGNYLTTAELLQPTQTWRELDKKVQKEIKASRLNLAQDFRVLIGAA
jgi:hypothetical protein